LWLRPERQTIKREFGQDTYDCAACKALPGVKEARHCWIGKDRCAVTFAENLPPIMLSAAELRVMLPLERPLDYLKKLTVGGKMICPVPLAEDPDALLAIQIQCDMTGGEGGWSALPFDRPILDWPLALANLLRFVRATAGAVQMEDMERQMQDARKEGS